MREGGRRLGEEGLRPRLILESGFRICFRLTAASLARPTAGYKWTALASDFSDPRAGWLRELRPPEHRRSTLPPRCCRRAAPHASFAAAARALAPAATPRRSRRYWLGVAPILTSSVLWPFAPPSESDRPGSAPDPRPRSG